MYIYMYIYPLTSPAKRQDTPYVLCSLMSHSAVFRDSVYFRVNTMDSSAEGSQGKSLLAGEDAPRN